jgi:hypothetical protein
MDGAGTTSQPQDYRFRTEPLAPGRHTFRLVQIDLDGTAHTFDIDVSSWASGTYLVCVAGTSAPATTRLTVIR